MSAEPATNSTLTERPGDRPPNATPAAWSLAYAARALGIELRIPVGRVHEVYADTTGLIFEATAIPVGRVHEVYDRIRADLFEAGYDHAIDDQQGHIDMHGIGLAKEEARRA